MDCSGQWNCRCSSKLGGTNTAFSHEMLQVYSLSNRIWPLMSHINIMAKSTGYIWPNNSSISLNGNEHVCFYFWLIKKKKTTFQEIINFPWQKKKCNSSPFLLPFFFLIKQISGRPDKQIGNFLMNIKLWDLLSLIHISSPEI